MVCGRIPQRMSTYLGIVAALEPEAAVVRRNLRMVRQTVHETGTLWRGIWDNQHVALVRCGMGAQRATDAVTWLVQHCPLWGVVSVGFAGALHQQMATGDAMLVSQIQRLRFDRATSTKFDGQPVHLCVPMKPSHQIAILHTQQGWPLQRRPW